jgi:hypothetical protein
MEIIIFLFGMSAGFLISAFILKKTNEETKVEERRKCQMIDVNMENP